MDRRIGFIGLGIMGRPMARNLVTAGSDLIVHSRSPGPVDDVVAAGARRAGSPEEVAASSDVVILMLPDTPDVEAVLFGPSGVVTGIAEGRLVIDMSSIEPLAARRFAERIGDVGAEMLDAPVSGGEKGAIDGTLSIMIGGSAAAVELAMPIFEILGGNIVHVGPSGAGQICKACNQLVVGATIEAVAEALALAERCGVDPVMVRQALLGGFASSRVLEVHGQRMLDRDFEPGFRARLHLKDAGIVIETGSEVGQPLPSFAPVAEQFRRLVGGGGGDLDHSALFTLIAGRDAEGVSPPVAPGASPP